jgi:hypothetical protein
MSDRSISGCLFSFRDRLDGKGGWTLMQVWLLRVCIGLCNALILVWHLFCSLDFDGKSMFFLPSGFRGSKSESTFYSIGRTTSLQPAHYMVIFADLISVL